MKNSKDRIDEALEDLKPVAKELDKQGYKNIVIDYDYFTNMEKISIRIKAERFGDKPKEKPFPCPECQEVVCDCEDD